MAIYEIGLVFTSLAILGAIALSRLLSDKPLSFPILYVGMGVLLFSLPLGVEAPNPVDHPELAERLTELVHGYGFIAVFVAALVLRHDEWTHDYYEDLHEFAVMIERLLMAAVLVLFGGTIVGRLLDPLTVEEIVLGLLIVFVVRPVAGLAGMIGSPESWTERAVIASFGIRGIGSFYYLSFALNEASFQEIELLVAGPQLWVLLGFVVLTSMTVHGVTATPVMNRLDRHRDGREVDADARPQ